MEENDATDLSDPLGTDAANDGIRTWKIFLRSGEHIEFKAGWSSNNTQGPAHFMNMIYQYQGDQTKPKVFSSHRFPKSNSDKTIVASVALDPGDVIGVSQEFG